MNEKINLIEVPRRFRYSTEWQRIVSGSNHWFSKPTMRFFDSRILWATLRPIAGDNFTFISSEQPPMGVRVYRLSEWNPAGDINDYGTFPSRAEALKRQRALHREEEAYVASFEK